MVSYLTQPEIMGDENKYKFHFSLERLFFLPPRCVALLRKTQPNKKPPNDQVPTQSLIPATHPAVRGHDCRVNATWRFPRQINRGQDSWRLSVLQKICIFLAKIQMQDPVSVHTIPVKDLLTAYRQREDTEGSSAWLEKGDKNRLST